MIKIVGIPNFAPEILRRVRLEDPMKSKQLKRALDDLAEEGVTQVFRRVIGGDNIVGVVGELQLDVLKTRVEAEYNVAIDLEPAPFETARWISAESKADALKARLGESACADGSAPRASCDAAEHAVEVQHRNALLSTVGLGVASASAIAGLGYLLFWPTGNRSEPSARLRPSGELTRTGATLAVSGEF